MPCKISESGQIITFDTLTYTTARGGTQTWTARVQAVNAAQNVLKITEKLLTASNAELVAAGISAVIDVVATTVAGNVKSADKTVVNSGLNLGKKNETNCLTQAIKEAESKYKSHHKKYAPENPKPMLAETYKSKSATILSAADFAAGVTVQTKLNGVRANVRLNETNGEIIMWSRSGDVYPDQPQITKSLRKMYEMIKANSPASHAPPCFDGELYVKGCPLPDIHGIARGGPRVDGPQLEYHIFDCYWPNNLTNVFAVRMKFLGNFQSATLPFIKFVKNYPVKSEADIQLIFEKHIDAGEEGIIIRRNSGLYKYSIGDARSNDLLKLKPRPDAEFPIVGYTSGKGKDLNAVIWECEVADPVDPADTQFSVVPKMTIEDRKKVFSVLGLQASPTLTVFEKYIKGQLLTIEYSEIIAKTGKPAQPHGADIRTKDSDPISDPIAFILEKYLSKA